MMTDEDLVEKYPFLHVYGSDGNQIDEVNWLSSVPAGWKTIFLDTCEKVKGYLEQRGMIDTYRIHEVKEKFGELRVYDSGGDDKVDDLWLELERESGDTCFNCGVKTDRHTTGWIMPCCAECAEKLNLTLKP